MFNLIVSGQLKNDRRGFIAAERVIQYTADEVEEKFSRNGELDFDAIMELPTLLMEEGRAEEIARIARLTKVTRKGKQYQLDYLIETDFPVLTNSQIDELQDELEMHEWELGTNHWAIKNVDLFEVLFRHAASKQPKPEVFKLPNKPVDPKLVSFMMPFSGGFDSVYGAIKDELESCGYRCNRADDFWKNHHIMEDIVELIFTSRVVICDLTSKNANVFYEAGIAHALGKDVVLITQNAEDVPFDLRPLRYISYLNNDEGRKKLTDEVSARIHTITE